MGPRLMQACHNAHSTRPLRRAPDCSAQGRTCVVACGKQQKAASTSPKLTSSILTSLGTLVAVMRCGNTSEKGCAGGGGGCAGWVWARKPSQGTRAGLME